MNSAHSQCNVSILSLGPVEQLQKTLDSTLQLSPHGTQINVISALPLGHLANPAVSSIEDSFDDFFSVYDAFVHLINTSTKDYQFILRAGAMLPADFFGLALSELERNSCLLAPARGGETLIGAEDLIFSPFFPAVTAFRSSVIHHYGGLRAAHQWYAPWAILAAHQMNSPQRGFALMPPVEMDQEELLANPISHYRAYAELLGKPEFSSIRENTSEEWAKLSHTLLGAIVEQYRDSFVAHIEQCLPSLLVTQTRMAELRGAYQRRKVSEKQALNDYRKILRQKEELEKAYHLLQQERG